MKDFNGDPCSERSPEARVVVLAAVPNIAVRYCTGSRNPGRVTGGTGGQELGDGRELGRWPRYGMIDENCAGGRDLGQYPRIGILLVR